MHTNGTADFSLLTRQELFHVFLVRGERLVVERERPREVDRLQFVDHVVDPAQPQVAEIAYRNRNAIGGSKIAELIEGAPLTKPLDRPSRWPKVENFVCFIDALTGS